MPNFKVVTINILYDLSRWAQRREVLAQGLADLAPDVIALQEVKLPENTARWLADRLCYTHIHLSPKAGIEGGREGIALLSRLPIQAKNRLDLGDQHRVAQYIRLDLDGQPVVIANAHFFWQPGNSRPRQAQIEKTLAWLRGLPGQPPFVLCGDFNATPDTLAIQRLYADLDSAYRAVHGREPDYTCPTLLPRAKTAIAKTLLGFFFLLRPGHLKLSWKGTLDYIFIDRRLKALDAQVVLNIPAPTDPRLYPSDHFGLYAHLDI